jgi:hypothetical protein
MCVVSLFSCFLSLGRALSALPPLFVEIGGVRREKTKKSSCGRAGAERTKKKKKNATSKRAQNASEKQIPRAS